MSTIEHASHPIAIPMEDVPLHTPTDPFCWVGDPTCPCHEDPDNLAYVHTFVEDGLLTPAEATRWVAGQQV